jgi:hypothetical protein
MRISDQLPAIFPGVRVFRLAGPAGDGRHPYCNEHGAYLGRGTALLARVRDASSVAHFVPRSEAALTRLLSKAYGRAVDAGRLMPSLGTVARALDRGDMALANIALVQAEIDPLPDEAAAERLAKADRYARAAEKIQRRARQLRAIAKAGFDPDQPRVPAGQSGGGEWTGGGDPQISQSSNAPRAYGEGHAVVIEYPDGSTETRRGGTEAWRNNNPGNIEDSDFSRRHGAIGNADGFAVFPDPETGRAAMDSLLRTSTYSQMSIDDAIASWASGSSNIEIAAYQATVKQITGFSGDTKVGDLDADQFASLKSAMERVEGSQPGTVTRTGPQQ